MGSFRKRLLVLIIGLGVVTQTVTLAAVLVSTRRTVEARAAEQLRSGGAFAQQLIRFRAGQLANGVAVLAADFGFREAVASGDAPTILSAARNNAQRIGADVVLLLDTHGRVLASTAPSAAGGAGALASLLEDVPSERDRPLFRVLGENSYQFFLAPVRTPEIIAWVAMGFVADDSLAQRVRDLVGAQVAILTHGDGGALLVASTLPPTERRAAFSAALSLPAAGADPAQPGGWSRIARVGETEYLSYARPLDSRGAAVDVILLKPLQEVL
ncbi:MAG: hypothetical protein E6K27_15500, partial [Gammaproteobacteria bacterium]